ncbi:MAG: AMP-binding protein [Deltaproteobacteria bacterium]|nr:AMP-binding protein [Deltaproteobacteria bacterium]
MNLAEILRRHSNDKPDHVSYRFISGNGEETDKLTYQELYQRVLITAGWISKYVKPNQRAVLIYPAGLDFIVAFWACLACNVIAVPTFPPEPRRLQLTLARLKTIISDSAPSIILTTAEMLEFSKTQLPKEFLSHNLIIATDRNITDYTININESLVGNENTLAMLQYTSGSTNEPKGVMLTHGNLIANQQMIAEAFRHNEKTVVVSWLPLYHDMGLIGCMLQPGYLGAQCILLAPESFLKNPTLWLKCITRYRATTSGGPNFAYDLCTTRISKDELNDLDLSSWQVAFNGAEIVRRQTMQRFADKFSTCGFRYSSFYPCYGLAEATLFVSGEEVQNSANDVSLTQLKTAKINQSDTNFKQTDSSIVSCGQAWHDEKLIIVNQDDQNICDDEEIGEIWVSGLNVAKGYFNNAIATNEVFDVSLPKESSNIVNRQNKIDGIFLRTGDLGFIKNGKLFVVGRLKDLIVVRGVNYYPQDIEYTVLSHYSNYGCAQVVVFSIDKNDHESVIVLVVPSRSQQLYIPENYSKDRGTKEIIDNVCQENNKQFNILQLCENIYQAILFEHTIAIDTIVFIAAEQIPKTSSGKVQHYLAKQKFIEDQFEKIFEWHSQSSLSMHLSEQVTVLSSVYKEKTISAQQIEKFLINWLAKYCYIEIKQIKIENKFAIYGLDSLGIHEMLNALEVWLNRSLSNRILLTHNTIAALSEHLATVFEQLPSLTSISSSKKITPKEAKKLLQLQELSDDEFARLLKTKKNNS